MIRKGNSVSHRDHIRDDKGREVLQGLNYTVKWKTVRDSGSGKILVKECFTKLTWQMLMKQRVLRCLALIPKFKLDFLSRVHYSLSLGGLVATPNFL